MFPAQVDSPPGYSKFTWPWPWFERLLEQESRYHCVAEIFVLFMRSKMSERETNVFLAKLAEQAERYEGKRTVFVVIVDFVLFTVRILGLRSHQVGYGRKTVRKPFFNKYCLSSDSPI